MEKDQEACGKGSGDEGTQEKNANEQNEQRAAEPNGEEEKSGLATLCEGILERLEFVLISSTPEHPVWLGILI